MMDINIFWPTGVQVPLCFQCPLAQSCFNWSRGVSYTKLRGRLMEPPPSSSAFTFQTDQSVQKAALDGMLGKDHISHF